MSASFSDLRDANASAGGVQPWSVGPLFPYFVSGLGNNLRGFNGVTGWRGPLRPYKVINGHIDAASFADAHEQAELDIALHVAGPLKVLANVIGLKEAA